jgi:hypothetical protein
MSQHYSDPQRESDPHALPDIETFKLTASECACMDEDAVWEAQKRFPLMHMNSRDRDKAIEWIIAEYGITGGWFWHSCFPGCMPDGPPIGPFDTEALALADAQQGSELSDEREMRATARYVWAIPLASRGFIPISEERNPVHWYIEDFATGRIADTKPYATKQDAEAAARAFGWIVEGS